MPRLARRRNVPGSGIASASQPSSTKRWTGARRSLRTLTFPLRSLVSKHVESPADHRHAIESWISSKPGMAGICRRRRRYGAAAHDLVVLLGLDFRGRAAEMDTAAERSVARSAGSACSFDLHPG